MEFNIETGICSNCIGVDKCTRGCIMHLGKALVDFLQGIDVAETRIGEYESREKGKKPDLVVSGHKIYSDSGSPSWILTDINTVLDISNKFMDAYGKNAFQIANMYCKKIGMDASETKEITDKIKAINNNKLLVVPFKPRTNCEIDYSVDGNTEKKKEATISYIKWATDKVTHQLDCTVGFTLQNNSITQHTKMSITDYIDKFRLGQMELTAKGSKHDKNLVKITKYGIFKPIVLKEGNVEIAVDGTYVYFVTNGDARIIGFWDDRGNLVVDKNIKSKAITKIKDNVQYIKNHKRYIAPYMLFEPNIIEMKNSKSK